MPRLYAIADRETLDRRGVGVAAFARELREAGVGLVQYRDKVNAPQEVLRAAATISEVFAGAGAMLVMNDRVDLAVLAGWGVHVGQVDMAVGDVLRVMGRERKAPHPSQRREGWATQREDSIRQQDGLRIRLVGVSTHTEAEVMRAEAEFCRLEGVEVRGEVETVGVLRLRDSQSARIASLRMTDRTKAEDSRNTDQPVARGLQSYVVAAKDEEPGYIAVGPVCGTRTKLDAEAAVGLEGVVRARALTRRPLVAIGGITLENCRSVVDAGADSVAVISGLFVEGRTVREVAEDFLRVLR